MSAVQRGESLGMQVARVLRERIVRGDLRAGERITEEALAEEFTVSRGPIRDAFTQLSFENLIQVRRPRGVFVIGLSADDVEQLYSLRAALEQLALSRAMRVTDDARWGELEASVARMSAAAEAGEHEAYAAADLDFHSQMYRLADHPRLESTWNQFLPTFAALIQVTINHDDDLHESLVSHEQLLHLMRSGESAAASEMLLAHLDGARDRMLNEVERRQPLPADEG